MITRAMKPTILEIPNFLSPDECDHIIELAKVSGLAQSVAGFDKEAYQGGLDRELDAVDETKPAAGPDDLLAERFDTWDKNNDGMIDMDEISSFALKYDKLYLNRDEVMEMLDKLKFQEPEKCQISLAEFESRGIKKLLTYLWYLKDKHPRHRPRYSEQAWLPVERTADRMLRSIQDRIKKLTKLPEKLIRTSESIQVVRYGEGGHYHGHLDSTPTTNREIPCCHQNVLNKPECKLCRFITILYYLNDVDEGGETAFVVADNETYTIDESLQDPQHSSDEFNLSSNCHKATLVIPPKRGTAVMWYNHVMDPVSGLLGEVDHFSFHGGCDIKRGVKWIANNWINAPTSQSEHIRSIYDLTDT
ncbi:transmembrane prolyl 4-hydroxylase isoform X2 [Nematostella vectensis]|nr:transmembrane prolyl 4-hydroxylase isoform X2 [Nematostella vectensis]